MLTAFWTPLTTLLQFSFRHQHYSHIVLVPLVSGALLILERRRIFSRVKTDWLAGPGLLAAGALLYALRQRQPASMSVNDQLSLTVVSFLLIVLGGFVLCYGLHAARAASFPLLFLFLMVPIPDFLLHRTITWLQAGSAEVSHVLFQLAGVPVLRTGFTFSMPGATIEVAEECSGIRSSLALLVTSLLIGHLTLRSIWAKAALILATLPVLIIKNGIRIATLSILAIYVDPRFLDGNLHHRGGIVFFIFALAFLALFLWFLKKSESRLRTIPVEALRNS